MGEQWRPVVGLEGRYEVSSSGRVRSLGFWRRGPYGSTVWCKPKILKGTPDRQGYLQIGLSGHGGVPVKKKIHRLVLEAFVGPCPPGEQTRHKNGHPSDNRIENLTWGTPSQNKWDKIRHGTDHHAKKTRCKNGHEFTPENTYTMGGTRRICRACRREVDRRRRAPCAAS